MHLMTGQVRRHGVKGGARSMGGEGDMVLQVEHSQQGVTGVLYPPLVQVTEDDDMATLVISHEAVKVGHEVSNEGCSL